jgi:ATP-dependent helicase YprA (DUF1998 family)
MRSVGVTVPTSDVLLKLLATKKFGRTVHHAPPAMRPARVRPGRRHRYDVGQGSGSQLEELEKYLGKSSEAPVTYARYTGTEKQEEREAIAANPPDILLTNFMMLELLMTRQDPVDRQVMANCEGLRFLVLDELHTYRGRQGADVALLVRRVRERLAPEGLQCIGTSATMASGDAAAQQAKSTTAVVSRVASQLFGASVPETNVFNTRPSTDHASAFEGSRAVACESGVTASTKRPTCASTRP